MPQMRISSLEVMLATGSKMDVFEKGVEIGETGPFAEERGWRMDRREVYGKVVLDGFMGEGKKKLLQRTGKGQILSESFRLLRSTDQAASRQPLLIENLPQQQEARKKRRFLLISRLRQTGERLQFC